MKNVLLILAIVFFGYSLIAQDTTQIKASTKVSDDIKKERDHQLQALNDQLKNNEDEVSRLKSEMSKIDVSDVRKRVAKLDSINIAQDNRINILENTRKTALISNGQLAFTELLSLQRDIQPGILFVKSQDMFSKLSNISNISRYEDFNKWYGLYKEWYNDKKSKDQMLDLVNNCVNLIGDISNKVPLYGSIVQTVSSGISSIIKSVGGSNKKVLEATPNMIMTLNAVSQFENNIAVIDHEWQLINNELGILYQEDSLLLLEQLRFYGIQYNEYQKYYVGASLDAGRDKFKTDCRQVILAKIKELESNSKTEDKWMWQVEIFMYKLQSLRIRFGNLTMRMINNIDRYKEVIAIYSTDKFPPKFTSNLATFGQSLNTVRTTMQSYFIPAKYIEDSAVMYISSVK